MKKAQEKGLKKQIKIVSDQLRGAISGKIISVFLEKNKKFLRNDEPLKAFLGILEIQAYFNGLQIPVFSYSWNQYTTFIQKILDNLLAPVKKHLAENQINEAWSYLNHFNDIITKYIDEQNIGNVPYFVPLQQLQEFLKSFRLSRKIAIEDIGHRLNLSENSLLTLMIDIQSIFSQFKVEYSSIVFLTKREMPDNPENIEDSKFCQTFPRFRRVLGLVKGFPLNKLCKYCGIPRENLIDAYLEEDVIFSNYEVVGEILQIKTTKDEVSKQMDEAQLSTLISNLDQQFIDWEEFEREKMGKVQ